MEQLTSNLNGKVRQATLGGRKYIIAPLTLIVPGVLNGSQGPLFYPQEEINKNPQDWNGVPIVLRHPVTESGSHVSARDPKVLENQGLGYVYHAKSNGKLKAEGWFDEEDTQRLAPQILSNLRIGKPIELSTGLFTDNEPAENGANYRGKAYTHVARNYRPDHLAILPDQEGACSVRDGCGVNVNQRRTNELSTSKQGRDNMAKRLTENRRSKIVDDLIANCGECGWDEEDRETLNSLSDSKLVAMDKHRRESIENSMIANAVKESVPEAELVANASSMPAFIKKKMEAKKEETCNEDDEECLAKNKKPTKNEETPKVEDKPLTNEQILAALSPEMKANLAFGSRGRAQWRAEAIERITANVEDEDQREKLAAKLQASGDEALEDILLVLPKKEEVAPTAPNYSGLGAGQPVSNRSKLTYMPLPGEVAVK